MAAERFIRVTNREREDTVEELSDWSRWARHSLSWGCWLLLAAAGAWPIAHVARGAATVPLIFAWLVSLRLCGLLLGRRH